MVRPSILPPPASVLVYVGLDLMGDGLMKLPFVRALRAAFPQAEITWLAGKGQTVYAGALAPLVVGLLDEVIEDAGIGSRWDELLHRPLAGRHFEVIIDTQRRVLTTLILKNIRHNCFISSAAKYLFSDVKPPKDRGKAPSMIRQLLDLVELASGAPAQPGAPLSLPVEAVETARCLLPDGPTYVGMAPGAGGRHKCWPLERYIELGRRQVQAGRVPVVFLGPGEREWDERIRSELPEAILPLSSDSSPALTIALGRLLGAAVANDSGAGHLLAAAEVPLFLLFGPTPPEKFAPFTPRLTIIRAQNFGGSVMQAIPVDAVDESVSAVL